LKSGVASFHLGIMWGPVPGKEVRERGDRGERTITGLDVSCYSISLCPNYIGHLFVFHLSSS